MSTPSKGVVVYTDSAAVTADIAYTKTAADDVTAKVDLNGNYVDSIDNGDATLAAGTDHTVASDGTITFKAGYLDTLAAGDYTLTLSYDPQGENYQDHNAEVNGTETNINDAPAVCRSLVTDRFCI